jgi:hypothetical protein
MSMKLGWNDLMITQLSDDEQRDYLKWFGAIMPPGNACRTVFFNRVGEWFVQTQVQAVHKVSVLAGNCSLMASTYEEFAGLVNSPAWQEENLWSKEVFGWKSEGIEVDAGHTSTV